MTLCSCKCLNVTLGSENTLECIDTSSLGLSVTEQRDAFFHENLSSCPVNAVKIEVCQPALLMQRQVGQWLVQSCLACGQTTHALNKDSKGNILINKATVTTPENIENLKKSNNYSAVFNMIIPDISEDVDMKEILDIKNIKTNDRKLPSLSLSQSAGTLSRLLAKTLQSKLEDVEDTVRQFRDQKFAEFESYREKAHRDHKILASILSKDHNNGSGDDWRTEPTDNGPLSPQLPPIQRRRLSSFKDAKKPKSSAVKIVSNMGGEEDSLEPEDIFDLEGTDSNMSRNDFNSDVDDYDSDPESGSHDEGIHIGRGMAIVGRGRRGGGDIARSAPVNMPNISVHANDLNFDDEVEKTEDIAASIKALARSVHADVFGDLPRPRFSTQI